MFQKIGRAVTPFVIFASIVSTSSAQEEIFSDGFETGDTRNWTSDLPCLVDSDCDDANDCTTDDCDVGAGTCSHSTLPGCCNVDGDCDDNNPCSIDLCCTEDHTCKHGVESQCCLSNSQCSDGNTCTIDSCDIGTSTCVHDPIPGCCDIDEDCQDNNPCTTQSCSDGLCSYTNREDCCLTNGDCYLGADPCSQPYCNTQTHICTFSPPIGW